MGINGNESAFAWLKSFIYLEAYVGLNPQILPARFCPSDQTPLPPHRTIVVCFSFRFSFLALVASGKVSLHLQTAYPSSHIVWIMVLDLPGIYALLALYGASTSTTTLACLATVINTPTTSAATIAQGVFSITLQQRVILLASYVPYFIIPLFIAVDMAFRLQKLASAGIRALETHKEK
jgi:hypothetical protein